MKKHLEKNKMNVFDFVPLTFAINLYDVNFEKQMNEFSRLFKSIELYHKLKAQDKILSDKKTGEEFIRSSYYNQVKEVSKLTLQT